MFEIIILTGFCVAGTWATFALSKPPPRDLTSWDK